jgi:2-polyprenyl-3-methyl-5-hydroxy-6-metoxy-1,4-benzoquinol methylase
VINNLEHFKDIITNELSYFKRDIKVQVLDELKKIDASIEDLKHNFELSFLVSNLHKHGVKKRSELSSMFPYEVSSVAANYLTDRQFHGSINYHELGYKDLNYVFKTAEDVCYVCYLYLQVEQYQPLYKVLDNSPECFKNIKRSASTPQRAKIIQDALQRLLDMNSYKALNILDIGSSLGYLSNFIADKTIHNVGGIDFDAKNNWIANLVSMNLKTGAHFTSQKLTKFYIDNLAPSYDVILYLSVLHHVNNARGTDYIRNIVLSTVNKSPFVFFELAHKGEEVSFLWKQSLPDNIMNYFDYLPTYDYKLHFLGEFATHLSVINRPLYLLERKYIIISDEKYYYNKAIFDAHIGVHTDKYSTIHRYYYTQDSRYFIKEYVELGNTEDLQHILNIHLKYLSYTANTISGISRLVNYELLMNDEYNYLVVVFDKTEGMLLSDIVHSIDINQAFLIANYIITIVAKLNNIGLNHGDIKIWNILYNNANNDISLIDFDHAYEISDNNNFLSSEQNKNSILWLLKNMNDKTFMKDEMLAKAPVDSLQYGIFDCLAKDILDYSEGVDISLNNKIYYFNQDTSCCSSIVDSLESY